MTIGHTYLSTLLLFSAILALVSCCTMSPSMFYTDCFKIYLFWKRKSDHSFKIKHAVKNKVRGKDWMSIRNLMNCSQYWKFKWYLFCLKWRMSFAENIFNDSNNLIFNKYLPLQGFQNHFQRQAELVRCSPSFWHCPPWTGEKCR